MTGSPTTSQLGALKWLRERGGDGVFDRNQVLVARGERAGVMRSTWSKLEAHGLVERYLQNRRLRVTELGEAADLRNIHAAAPADAGPWSDGWQ